MGRNNFIVAKGPVFVHPPLADPHEILLDENETSAVGYRRGNCKTLAQSAVMALRIEDNDYQAQAVQDAREILDAEERMK